MDDFATSNSSIDITYTKSQRTYTSSPHLPLAPSVPNPFYTSRIPHDDYYTVYISEVHIPFVTFVSIRGTDDILILVT